jgi:hypothetical protein
MAWVNRNSAATTQATAQGAAGVPAGMLLRAGRCAATQMEQEVAVPGES